MIKLISKWSRSLYATAKSSDSVARAEQAGLVFAFRARLLALSVVSIWLLFLVQWPRNVYYFSLALCFFVLGYVPFLFRQHRHAEFFKLLFVVLDVMLVTAAILLPPPEHISIDWPVQTRLRGQVFLFLLLLLSEAALTSSPIRVLWTGTAIGIIWSLGALCVYNLPNTVRYADALAAGPVSDASGLSTYLSPTYVDASDWSIQIVATALVTVLTALAVLRSRMHLLAEARAEAGRSDLARYVSPDVAEALAEEREFGKPATREVAVLFADIVGFTGFTERLSPERAFALLRSFQERSSGIVVRQRGTLDKYLGDGLMATFGALRDDGEAARRAIDCAFELRDEMDRWNAKRLRRGAAPIRVAIGLHHGPVMVGHLGSDQRIEFTVVGDVVNVTSRLEKACRELGCLMVVSADCVAAGGEAGHSNRFDRTVEISLRGRGRSIVVHVAGSPIVDPARAHLGEA